MQQGKDHMQRRVQKCRQARSGWYHTIGTHQPKLIQALSNLNIGNREKEGINKNRYPRQSCLIYETIR